MNRLTEKIKKEYAANTEREWVRLIRDPYHLLEFNTSLKFLKRYLPKKGLIMDAGGGPGRYSIELAKQGYDVVLLDIVPESLKFAKKQAKKEKVFDKIKRFVEGDMTDLSKFDDDMFDAVICLGGPLSHVHPESERKKAISELVRVAKKNAPIFISVMGKYGVLAMAPSRWPHEIEMKKHFIELYTQGDDYIWHGGKSFAHYFEVNELKRLVEPKMDIIKTIGLEGLATPTPHAFNAMAKNSPKAYKHWLEMHEKLCTRSQMAEMSLHFMVIGRKK